ncbi:hypothetical protein [Mycobacterium dioxanotrophicus]|uniref:hypothetical protein n=1 Tax=Mycobacterium dioxanotrophicus TaxID=482462 RepID=UPI0018DFCA7E|nr:hypothetical protein [Mycobacterium dioxanotrophicus]
MIRINRATGEAATSQRIMDNDEAYRHRLDIETAEIATVAVPFRDQMGAQEGVDCSPSGLVVQNHGPAGESSLLSRSRF